MWRNGRAGRRLGTPVKRTTSVLAGAAFLAAATGMGCRIAPSNAEPGSAVASVSPGPASTAQVEKGKLSAMVSLDGTLTYRAQSDGSPYPVINHARGTYTQLPSAGDKVDCGEVLYRVDDRPVLLLCGTVPAYRDLHISDVGQDVRQLNQNLHTLGYDAKAGVVIDPEDNTFTSSTEKALQVLQRDKGFAVTGKLAVGDAVFLPEPARIVKVTGELGGSALPGAQGPTPADVAVAQAAVDAASRQVSDAQAQTVADTQANQQALQDASKNLAAVQAQMVAAAAAAKASVQVAQQALSDAQKQQAALPPVIAQQIASAKAKLYADQTTWDAQVARGAATQEQRQSALDADQTAIDQAVAAGQQQLVQGQAAVDQAKTASNQATAALQNDLAKFQGQITTAQSQVDGAPDALNITALKDRAQIDAAVSALQTARAMYNKTVQPPSQAAVDTTKAVVLYATSDVPEVQVNLDPSQQSEVKTGDLAQITLPGNRSVTGKVDRLGKVAQVPPGQSNNVGAATIPAYISLAAPAQARGLDQAPVQVDITTKGVNSALSVPVTALVGKSGGGFAVEVVRAGGRRELVAVKLGLFDTSGGRVQVEGNLAQGDRVVVPSL